jgi:hypothetical protein
VTTPILALPNFSKPFVIETDASDIGVGAVLMQEGHPLAFLNKALGPKSRGLSTYEKEYMTILLAVQQWRPYLQQSEFYIHTDHKSLSQLNEQRLHTSWQHKVFSKLLGLQYQIIYKKSTENRVADALSRRIQQFAELQPVSVVQPQWLLVVQNNYSADLVAQELLTKLAIAPDFVPHFSLLNGLLRYKSKVWIGQDPYLHSQLLSVMHNLALGGHSRVPMTYNRLKQIVHWKGIKKDAQKFVQDCQVCIQANADRAPYPGKL